MARTSAARSSTGIIGSSPGFSTRTRPRRWSMIACHSLISRIAPSAFTVLQTPVLSIAAPVGGSRSGVSLRGSLSASTFDSSGCPSLFLRDEGQFALGVLGMATRISADHQGASKAIEGLVLATDVDCRDSHGRGLQSRWPLRRRTEA